MRYLLILASLFMTLNMVAQSDLCASAPLLNVGTGCTTTGYNVQGTWAINLTGPQFTCASNYRDGFYRFVATSTVTQITITDDDNGPDPGLAIYRGACTSLTLMACSDIGNNVDEVAVVPTTIGQTYYVAIIRTNNNSNNSMTGDICISSTVNHQNCIGTTQICSNSSFSGNSSGSGTQELTSSNKGCLTTEHQSSWYIFQAQSTGSISLSITTNVDYDFAIWGPNVGCTSLGTPVRCSYAAGGGNTGLGSNATDLSEGSDGNRWVAPLAVTSGQTYIMLIDNFTSNSTPFTIDFNGTTASLNCSTLPIELVSFEGIHNPFYNLITWRTAAEINNDYFTLEKSPDAIHWTELSIINGAGNSIQPINYEFKDRAVDDQLVYYRLKQTDFDGYYKYSPVISVEAQATDVYMTELMPNPTEEAVSFEFYTAVNGTLNIQLIDHMGKVAEERKELLTQGKNSITIQTNELLNGIYIARIYFDKSGFSSTTKLIKH